VRCLLDTHTFLWAASNSARLSPTARDLIEDANNTPFVSMASLWEIAIKLSTGKLSLDVSFAELAFEKPAAHGIAILPTHLQHLEIVTRLPFHHRDPFDRLLVAQALVEELPLVSSDTMLDSYGIERFW
jgi:PIN domain nuclease of toxin-antitoxin system